MKIAYRRMSGPIGFTEHETGTRGLWLEKRNALVKTLEGRGHRVDFVNRMTKFSRLVEEVSFESKSHDFLFVEFGSSNEGFYKEDLAKTRAMVSTHRGRVVFLCDDPDLPYQWKSVEKAASWTVWMNAMCARPFGGQSENVPCYDAPFSSLLPTVEPSSEYQRVLVYLGRPLGRKATLKVVEESGVLPWVYGREAEWDGYKFPIHPSPTQVERASFYSGKMGSLVLADSKHKRLGWRTGRAYHALHAGCPPLGESDHPAMQGFPVFDSATSLREIASTWREEEPRYKAWLAAKNSESRDREIMEATFVAHGL